jgi:beta-glucosidase
VAEAAFPADFLWGLSSAALCVEGAAEQRAETIWEPFCRRPGAVRDGSSPAIACGQLGRWDQDLEILGRLGVNSYRFSISWARALGTGGSAGAAGSSGLDFYQRLTDSLLAAGIRPVAALYHWDLPQQLEEQGGWRNRDTARRFADHAAVVYRALGDRIQWWITHNDPWASAFHGYGSGSLAPGARSEQDAVSAAHVLLLSHALAVQACAASRRPGSRFGAALGLTPVLPATPEDEEPAFWADCWLNRWCLDPLLRGRYPEELLQVYTARHPRWDLLPEDLDALAGARPDFLGVNYFTCRRVGRPADRDSLFSFVRPEGLPRTAAGWEIRPEGLRELLLRLDRDYDHPELLVTANGACFEEAPSEEGIVEDRERISFLESHLVEAHRAWREGARLRGWFPWTLLDGFEWSFGFSRPFGLVAVDRQTLKRTWKRSAFWYRDLITRGGL